MEKMELSEALKANASVLEVHFRFGGAARRLMAGL